MIIVRHKKIMRAHSFMVFLLCFKSLQAINQTCSFIEPCPNHADCNPLNNFCVCEQGYIGNCNIQVDPVGQYPQIVQLAANDTRLFYMKPIEVEQYIEFTLSICRGKDKKNVPVDLYVWTENGSNTEYLFSNTVSSPLRISFDSECNILITKFVTFGIQPNGQSQMLVLGIGNNKQPATLTLTVSQRLVLNLTFYFYIVVGLIIFVSLLAIMSAVMFFIRRRRRFGRLWTVGLLPSQIHHNIDHFQAYMPSIQAVERPGEKQECPICLQSIDNQERIRVTPCNHVFHTICLDAWCIQNINCPVCRSDFSLDKIGEIQKVVIINNSKSAKGYQDKWQQNIEIEMDTVQIEVEKEPPMVLKQPML